MSAQDRTVYLTPEGKARFTAELHELTTVRRHEAEERIRHAKEGTDAVDNPEYEEAKNEQAFIEGRIKELERLLATATIIEAPVARPDYVKMGSRVTVVDRDREEQTYHLVGSSEAEPRKGLISNESPIGRALLGKRVNDEVLVAAPAGSFTLTITRID
ncbi:MAG: transcription elongation factor GreA [Chloroflexi bacterium]|nr:transcription elongation factor GreA [Chloroflexota bacterium]